MNQISKINIDLLNQRLKTLFNNVPDAKSICLDLELVFKDTNKNIETLKKQNDTFILEFNQAEINLIKNKHQKQSEVEAHFQTKIKSNENELKNELKNISSQQKQTIINNKLAIENTFAQKKAYSSQIQHEISNYKQEQLQTNELIKQKEKEEKNKYQKRLNTIYEQKTNDVIKINSRYHEIIKDFHTKNKKRLTTTTEKTKQQEDELTNFLTFREKDAIIAKQNFYRSLTSLNKVINVINNNFKKTTSNLNKKHINKQEEKYDKLNLYKEEIVTSNNKILDSFEKELKELDSLIDNCKNKHNEAELKLKRQYQRDVTSVNTVLQKDKDKHNKLLEEVTYDYLKDKALNMSFPKAVKKFSKYYKKTKKAHVKAFLKIEKKALADIKVLTNKYYKDLFSLNKKYNAVVETHRAKLKVKDEQKNVSLKLNKDLQALKENTHKKIIASLNKENNIKSQITSKTQQLEILPFDIQTRLASHIYDIETAYQNLEQNFKKQNKEIQVQIIENRAKLGEHYLIKRRDRNKLFHDYEIEKRELNNYFAMNIEKANYSFITSSFLLDYQLGKATYSINALKAKQKQEAFVEKNNSNIKKINLLERIALEKSLLNEAYLKETFASKTNKARLLLEKDINLIATSDTRKISALDYTKQQKSLENYFSSLNYIKNTQESILAIIKDSYYLFPLKTKFSEILTGAYELLVILKDFQDSMMDYIRKNTIIQMKEKIDTLMFSKYQKLHQNMLDEFEKNKTSIQNQITALEEDIKQTRLKAVNHHENIASYKNQNQTVKKTISFIKNQIENLKSTSKNKQTKKTIVQLKEQIKALKKQVLINKAEIRFLYFDLKRVNKQLLLKDKENKTYPTKMNILIKDKENQEASLKRKQYLEGKIFYNGIQLITDYYKKYKTHTATFLNSVGVVFAKIKEKQAEQTSFEKQYKKIERIIKRKSPVNTLYYQKISSLIQKQHQLVVNKQTKIEISYQKIYERSLKKQQLNLKQKNIKVTQNINKINRYEASIIALTNENYKKALTLLKQKHKHDLKSLQEKKEEIIKNQKALKQQHQEQKKAFNLNYLQVALKKESEHKNALKQTDKRLAKSIKQIRDDYSKATTELSYILEKNNAQLKYFSKSDKDQRKSLDILLLTKNANLNKEINGLLKIIPTINKHSLKVIAKSDKNKTEFLQKAEKKKLNIQNKEKRYYFKALTKSNQKLKMEFAQKKDS